jgi:PAS domain S-box-containing protein
MKIANRISLYSFLSFTFVITISLFFLYSIVKVNIEKLIYKDLERRTVEVEEHIERLLLSHKKKALVLAGNLLKQEFLKAIYDNKTIEAEKLGKQVNASLLKNVKEEINIYEIFILNNSGKIIASSDFNNIGLNKETDSYFLGAKEGPYIKDIYYSETLKENIMAVAVPIKDSKINEFLGVLVFRVNLDDLYSILKVYVGSGKTDKVYLVNKYGYMITPSRFRKDTFLNQRINLSLKSKKKLGSFIFIDYRGKKVLRVIKYISEMKWYVFADIDKSEAFYSLIHIRTILFSLFFLMPLLSWLIGRRLSRVIIRQISKLQKGAKIIGEGDFDYKIELKNLDEEIIDVSISFNKMIHELKTKTISIENLNKEIEARKKVEQALSESEKQFKRLVANIPGVVYRCALDKEWQMKYISDEIEKLSGYSATDFINNNVRSYNDVIYSEDQEMFFSVVEKTIKQKKDYTIEYRIVHLDGSIKWVYEKGQGVFDDKGNFLYLNGVIFDIDDKKEVELELKKINDFNQVLLDVIPYGMDIVDEQGNILFVNKILQSLFKEDIKGKKCWEVYKDDKNQCDLCPLKEDITVGKTAAIETPCVLGGKYVHISHTGMIYQGKKAIFELFIDITERRKEQENILKLSQAIKYSPSEVVITDYNGEIEYVNPKFIDITGYKEEEVLGENPRILKSGNKAKEEYEDLWKTINSGKEWRGEFLNKKKNGETYWEAASISAIKDEKDNITHFVKVAEDVTKRKQAEEKVKEAIQIKTDFVSMVSHELRTPLMVIKEGLGVVLDGLAGKTTHKQEDILDIAKNNTDRLARLISQVLDFQKLDAGKVQFNKKLYNINDVILEVQEQEIPLLEKKGLELISKPDNKLPEVSFDKDKIIQVLTNIISNSVNFTEKGSITIISSKQDNNICVEIKDTGIGIKKEDLDKLFNKFEQLEKGFERHPGGTGLGLAISKDIIEEHGGRIWVESEFGKGSSFFFTLPI